MDPDQMRDKMTADVLSERFKQSSAVLGEKPVKLDKRFKENREILGLAAKLKPGTREDGSKIVKDEIRPSVLTELFIEGMKIIANSRQAKTEKELRECIPAAHAFVNIIKEYKGTL